MYKYYNANSHNNFINDCVIRAISTIENKTWDESYKELSTLAREKGLLLDDVNFVRSLLDERYKRLNYHDYVTIGEFAEEHSIGRFLVTTRGHITCIIDGVVIDTWDCRNKLVENIWIVKK